MLTLHYFSHSKLGLNSVMVLVMKCVDMASCLHRSQENTTGLFTFHILPLIF